VGPAIGTKS